MNAILALLVLLAQPSKPPTAGPDEVTLKDGKVLKGKITKLSSTQVLMVDTSSKSHTLKNEDVRDVKLGDTPSTLNRANQAAQQKNFDKALTLYEAALTEIGQNKDREPLHKQYLYYNWAVTLDQKGEADQALGMMKRLRMECGDCRLRLDSFRTGLAIARKLDDAKVNEILEEMKAEPEPIGSEAQVELARSHYRKGDYGGAQSAYERLSTNSNTGIADEGKLGILRCLRALRKMDDLKAACGKYTGDRATVSPALYQAGCSGLAEAMWKDAGGDKTKVREVLVMCAQAISVGPPAARDQAEEYAQALLIAGRCSLKLSEAAEKPEAKNEYKSRAIGYWSEVMRYGGTPWAEAAKKELGALSGEAPKEEQPK